jgi:hypothetical protein
MDPYNPAPHIPIPSLFNQDEDLCNDHGWYFSPQDSQPTDMIGKRIQLEVQPTDTVDDVRRLIENMEGTSPGENKRNFYADQSRESKSKVCWEIVDQRNHVRLQYSKGECCSYGYTFQGRFVNWRKSYWSYWSYRLLRSPAVSARILYTIIH